MLRQGELYRSIEAIEAAIPKVTGNRIYQRSGSLVRTLPGSSQAEALNRDSLQVELNRAFAFKKQEYRGPEEGLVDIPIDCPTSIPSALLAIGLYPTIPELDRICSIPVLSVDGHVRTRAGYDPHDRVILRRAEGFNLEVSPTKDQAQNSLEILKDLLSEFNFKSEFARGVALAMLLTVVTRHLYSLAPMFAVSASQAGTGKSILSNLASIFLSGSADSCTIGYSEDESEMGKKVFAALLRAVPLIWSLD